MMWFHQHRSFLHVKKNIHIISSHFCNSVRNISGNLLAACHFSLFPYLSNKNVFQFIEVSSQPTTAFQSSWGANFEWTFATCCLFTFCGLSVVDLLLLVKCLTLAVRRTTLKFSLQDFGTQLKAHHTSTAVLDSDLGRFLYWNEVIGSGQTCPIWSYQPKRYWFVWFSFFLSDITLQV